MCLCLISKSNRGYFPKRCPGNNRYPALVAVTVLRTFVVRAALPITLKPLGEPNWTAQVRSRETPFESPKAPWRPLHRRLPERVECRRLDSVSFTDNWHSDDYMATHSTGGRPPAAPTCHGPDRGLQPLNSKGVGPSCPTRCPGINHRNRWRSPPSPPGGTASRHWATKIRTHCPAGAHYPSGKLGRATTNCPPSHHHNRGIIRTVIRETPIAAIRLRIDRMELSQDT